jgi:uncharacterized protein
MSDVRNNRAENRFELKTEEATAIAAYRRHGQLITFTHTEVPAALEGQGIGTRLIAGALVQVRAEGLKVVPVCSFVRRYFESHDEVQDLLAQPGED